MWVYELNRETATKLVSEGLATRVTWTPDNRRVVFGWSKSGNPNLYWRIADASSPKERLTRSENPQFPSSWSPDGEYLAFVQAAESLDVLLLRLKDRSVLPFLNSRFSESNPEFSPDGRWISYTSDESGRNEVYVQPFPGPGGRWKMSNTGGSEPLWSRDGTQLYYRQLNSIWVVDVRTDSGFRASKPRLVFEQAGYSHIGPVRTWDLSPDGRRFLMVKLGEEEPQPITELILVQDWFEELRRLVPTGRN